MTTPMYMNRSDSSSQGPALCSDPPVCALLMLQRLRATCWFLGVHGNDKPSQNGKVFPRCVKQSCG